MRTAVPRALPLFRSEMQVRLLALVCLQPEREWTAEELAELLKAPLSSVHRELSRAQDAGIVLRNATARPHRFRADGDSPLLAPISELLDRTVGVEAELAASLAVPGVLVAAIHGSWVEGPRRPDSDVDVVVVGEMDLRELRRLTRQAAGHAGRRIDLTSFTPEEFRALVDQDRGFVRHLRLGRTVPLVGDLDDWLIPPAGMTPAECTTRVR